MKDKDKKKATYQMRSVNPAESEIAVSKTAGYTGKRKLNPSISQLKSRLLRVKP
jgi:hypothetical protein